ncbi:biotin/lipoate a/B protein ligase family domain-containing protein [Ditylenchus destructor]|uniref:Biotin/lipoate a/B protein ligase family domain-containing protein n=1 Tax=Ditylenchus destructor TaxID=166010 RepID=A0AAD4N7H2_9BILA|nr:biotin/lipoate a/B protein ligase family domain-containing protein [Ditylenchus destructor]
MFLALSLILTGVKFARRRRLHAILSNFFNLQCGESETLFCRISQHFPPFRYSSIYKATSESALSNSVNILYKNETREVYCSPEKIILQSSDWISCQPIFSSSLTSLSSKCSQPFIFFIIRIKSNVHHTHKFHTLPRNGKDKGFERAKETLPDVSHQNNGTANQSDCKSSEAQDDTTLFVSRIEQEELDNPVEMDSVASLVAYNSKTADFFLYKSRIDIFADIVFSWSEGNLLKNRAHVEEIISVQSPDDLFTQCSQASRSNTLSFGSSSSRSSTRSRASLHVFLNEHAQNRSEMSPYTLLETLYFKDVYGFDPNKFINRYSSVVVQQKSIYNSDTCLYKSTNKRNAIQNFKLPSTDWLEDEGNLSDTMTLSTGLPSTFRDTDRSASVVPNYICKIRTAQSSRHDSECSDSRDLESNGQSFKSKIAQNCEAVSLCSTLDDISKTDTTIVSIAEMKESVASEQICTDDKTDANNENESRDYSHIESSSTNHRSNEQPSASQNLKLTIKTDKQDVSMDAKAFPPKPLRTMAHTSLLLARDLQCRRYSSQVPDNGWSLRQFGTSSDGLSKRQSLSVAFSSGRSLSPLTKSLLANYGSRDILDTKINSPGDEFLFTRKANSVYQRRYHSMPRQQYKVRRYISIGPGDDHRRAIPTTITEPSSDETSNTEVNRVDTVSTSEEELLPSRRMKPPAILVYTGDQPELFDRIATSLKAILPLYRYTVNNLSVEALTTHPWIDDNCACLMISDTDGLNDQAWQRLQQYFVNSGKILFLCQNSLLASLTHCGSAKKQSNILKKTFGKKSTILALGKDFEQFLKKTLKKMENDKEVYETFHSKDIVGGCRFSVALSKKTGQPLLLYMQNAERRASALFSDATTDQLLTGNKLISEAMLSLGVHITVNSVTSTSMPQLSRGYLVCQKDSLLFDIKGLSYDEPLGSRPQLFFYRPTTLSEEQIGTPDSRYLPIEICRRKITLPVLKDEFNYQKYFEQLRTKSLGRVLLYVPTCESTLDISKSLSHAFPDSDGILVMAGNQTKGRGRGGNEWISPKGCALFTFNFNVPVGSCLGKSIGFVQHILAVSVVDAIISLLKDQEFPLHIKWPNDVYYERKHKLGGVMVNATIRNNQYECIVASGLNVSNSRPTVCLNDFLPADCYKKLCGEEVIAETMNKFEYYVNMFVNKGKDELLRHYYAQWLHTHEEVSIVQQGGDSKEKVIIRGLDAHGFLEVRSKQTGQIYSVHDDGNTFDMMKGLIRPKH